ncbi:MAG: DUF3311 domain-containing protein [Acidimicrobiales bacterium]
MVDHADTAGAGAGEVAAAGGGAAGGGVVGARAARFADAPGRFVVVFVLLGATFVGLLWVPSYAHITPTLGGIPFFYWYSVLWLVVNAISQIVAYRIVVGAHPRPAEAIAP